MFFIGLIVVSDKNIEVVLSCFIVFKIVGGGEVFIWNMFLLVDREIVVFFVEIIFLFDI